METRIKLDFPLSNNKSVMSCLHTYVYKTSIKILSKLQSGNLDSLMSNETGFKSLQRRAIKMISNSHDSCAIYAVKLDNLAQQFFHKICDINVCINYTLPNKRAKELLSRLR